MFRVLLVTTALLLLVLSARAFTVRSMQVAPYMAATPAVDAGVAEKLSRAVQLRTISTTMNTEELGAEFSALHGLLSREFPRCSAALKREVVNGQSLLYTWRGENPALSPYLFLAHLDVVPIEAESTWRYEPFSGQIAEGAVWGRGAMDDKGNVIAMLEAVEQLLAHGFKPKRTLYLAFGADEEIGGKRGAKRIAEHLRAQGITLDFALDEGLFIFKGSMPGVSEPVAYVGIAEKGYLDLELSVESAGGHSSIPPREPAVTILSQAIVRLRAGLFPPDMRGAARTLFDAAAPEMSLPYRFLFANRWLFEPVLLRLLARDPASDAMIRTTVAPTMLKGSQKSNVLPVRASAVINIRILPGDSISTVVRRVREVIDDPRVIIAPVGERNNPIPAAATVAPAFEEIQRTIRSVFPGVIVVPSLVLGGTDSKHFADLARNIYRFSPFEMDAELLKGFHGTNERLSIENLKKLVVFYYNLITRVDQLT